MIHTDGKPTIASPPARTVAPEVTLGFSLDQALVLRNLLDQVDDVSIPEAQVRAYVNLRVAQAQQ